MEKINYTGAKRVPIFPLLVAGMALFAAVIGFSGTANAATVPVVTNGSVNVPENGSATGMLMASDTNSPALPLTYSVVTGPSDGALSNVSASSGAFTYTPNNGFIGNDMFTFMVSNGEDSNATGTETLVVGSSTSSSTAPVISNIGVVASDTQATVTWTTDQSANSQVAYGTSTAYGSSSALDGTLVTSHSVLLTGLMPSTTYDFSVMSGNGSGTMGTSSNQTFLTIATPSSTATSTPSSTAPVVTNGSLTVAENSSVMGTLMASDTNSPALPLTFSIVNGPSDGTLSNLSSSSDSFTYTPNNGFTGTDMFTFMVNNGQENSATGTETITVQSTASSTASSTAPVISGIGIAASDTQATITWTTDQSANSGIAYGTASENYPWSEMSSNLGTSHSVTLFGLTPMTTYYFTITSGNASGTAATSSEQMFTTIATPTTTTSSSTLSEADFAALEAQIQQLEQQIMALIQRLEGTNGNGGTGNNNNGQPMANATIEPQNPTVQAGTSIDFGGRNFAPNERVTVTSNGQTVTTAQADGGGNFSTGSLPVPNTTSTTSETYTFTGQTSGTTLSDTITISPQ